MIITKYWFSLVTGLFLGMFESREASKRATFGSCQNVRLTSTNEGENNGNETLCI